MQKKPPFDRDFDLVVQVDERQRFIGDKLKEYGAEPAALDALGQEPATTWFEFRGKRPFPAIELRRAKMLDIVNRYSQHETISALAGFPLNSFAPHPIIVPREFVLCLIYDMTYRREVAERRVKAERNLIGAVAGDLPKALKAANKIGVALTEIGALLQDAANASIAAQDAYRRKDEMMPPERLLRGILEDAPRYFALFRGDRPLYCKMLGVTKRGGEETLGYDSAFGAFVVILHGLATPALKRGDVSADKLDASAADIANIVFETDFEPCHARYRRHAFAKERGFT